MLHQFQLRMFALPCHRCRTRSDLGGEHASQPQGISQSLQHMAHAPTRLCLRHQNTLPKEVKIPHHQHIFRNRMLGVVLQTLPFQDNQAKAMT
jgi:hypothetical protein